jgi:hypothetical protein
LAASRPRRLRLRQLQRLRASVGNARTEGDRRAAAQQDCAPIN